MTNIALDDADTLVQKSKSVFMKFEQEMCGSPHPGNDPSATPVLRCKNSRPIRETNSGNISTDGEGNPMTDQPNRF